MQVCLQGNSKVGACASLMLDIGEGKLSTNGNGEIQISSISGTVIGSISNLISHMYPDLRVLKKKRYRSDVVNVQSFLQEITLLQP